MPCLFCEIAIHQLPAAWWYEDEFVFAFLDKKPLFPGHTLLIPKQHIQTFHDLPADLNKHFFKTAQQLADIVKKTMSSEGTFVAMNNIVSQSVPHFHLHIVPRTKGDGLKGFFWPSHSYKNDEQMYETAERLKKNV